MARLKISRVIRPTVFVITGEVIDILAGAIVIAFIDRETAQIFGLPIPVPVRGF